MKDLLDDIDRRAIYVSEGLGHCFVALTDDATVSYLVTDVYTPAREHGINPLASVGPMLLQIPVFISLYMLLRHDATNGLFGDGGFLFIPDLTAKPTGGVLVAMLTIYICS